MITFLKRIRKSLIDSGSGRRYIIYAIGEIALVVIGILIALQINNWNEWRKERTKENEILKELQETLETNVSNLQKNYDNNLLSNKSSQIIISVIDKDIPYHDSLNMHFQRAEITGRNLFISEAGYEGLKNIGFEILRNSGLKSEIIHLFEVSYKSIWEPVSANQQYDQINAQFLSQHFYRIRFSLIPFDFDKTRIDNFFYSMLHRDFQNREWHNVLIKNSIEATERVLYLIEEELDKK